jgi:hypothetical protein
MKRSRTTTNQNSGGGNVGSSDGSRSTINKDKAGTKKATTSDHRPFKKTKDETINRRDEENNDLETKNSTNKNTPSGNRWTKPQWKREDTPSFLDATATVSVATFAGRRLPELKQLYEASMRVVETEISSTSLSRPERSLQSGGGKSSNRHLRRRTTAVQSKRHRHRYPSSSSSSSSSSNVNGPKNGNNTTMMMSEGADVAVAKSVVTSNTTTTTSTTAESMKTATAIPAATELKFQGKTRKSKRKKGGLLSQTHWRWLDDEDTVLSSSSSSLLAPLNGDNLRNEEQCTGTVEVAECKEDGQQVLTIPSTTKNTATNWLATHLWHAKRFHMGKFWNWSVPLAHTNRGARAALRLSSTSSPSATSSSRSLSSSSSYCMLRDISFERQPLLLSVKFHAGARNTNSSPESSQRHMAESVLRVLGRVCPDLIGGGRTISDDDERNTSMTSFLSGVAIKEGMLHEVDQFPRNAIGPVLWRIIHHPDGRRKNTAKEDKGDMNVSPSTLTIIPWTVEVRCHPSIRTQVRECLTALMTDLRLTSLLPLSSSSSAPTTPPPTFLTIEWEKHNVTADDSEQRRNNRSPRICFRLYGSSSTRVLNEIIVAASSQTTEQESAPTNSFIEWNQIISDHHNKVNQNEMHDDENGNEFPLFHGAIVRIRNISIRTIAEGQQKHSITELPSAKEIKEELFLTYQSPRPLDCDANYAMSGWEIYCSDVKLAKEVWIAMSTTRVPLQFDDDGGGSKDEAVNSTTTILPSDNYCCCCVIGLVEDSHLRLECEPPLPVFPRDYVDTKESDLYWKTNPVCDDRSKDIGERKNDDNKGAVNVNNIHYSTIPKKEWQRIRQLFDSGWGRLPFGKNTMDNIKVGPNGVFPIVDFFELLPSHNKNVEESGEIDSIPETAPTRRVVTVRGAFGYPFLNAIRACARFDAVVGGNDEASIDDDNKDSDTKPSRRRRKRRVSRPQNQTICAPLLSKTERKSFVASCTQLLSSLTLPAVLLAHVRSLGKGPISAGMEIVSCMTDANNRGDDDLQTTLVLGRTTSGGFSRGRGVCHGLGIVGASILLEYLARVATTNDQHYGRLVRLRNGDMSIQLLVSVRQARGPMKANEGCLSLVLD